MTGVQSLKITSTEGNGLGAALRHLIEADECPEGQAALASLAMQADTGDLGLDIDLFNLGQQVVDGEAG